LLFQSHDDFIDAGIGDSAFANQSHRRFVAQTLTMTGLRDDSELG